MLILKHKKWNRRASLEIVLLVLMTLLVVGVTIFVFTTQKYSFNKKIGNVISADDSYYDLSLIEFYIKQAGENAFYKTYKEVVESREYLDPVITNLQNEVEFRSLNSNLNEEFKTKFNENLKREYAKYNFEDKQTNLNRFKDDYIKNDKFKIEYDGKRLKIMVDDFTLINGPEGEDITIKYNPDILLEYDFRELGLNSFNQIYTVKELCVTTSVSLEEMENCFSLLNNFDVAVEEKTKPNSQNGETYDLVTLTSKREFFIDGTLQKIEIKFIPS